MVVETRFEGDMSGVIDALDEPGQGGVPIDEVYAAAIDRYVSRHDLTSQINASLRAVESDPELDQFSRAAARKALGDEDW